MKLSIKPYWISLIKENYLYVVFDLILIVLIIFSITYSLSNFLNNKATAVNLSQEIQTLKNKITLLNSTPDSRQLESDLKLLNMLVPNAEDYFSIIYSLDELSKKTNFIIVSYSVNLQKSTSNKLRLTVTGIGDQNALLNFLKDYNFAGGRLITSDKIELTPQQFGGIKIDITFYSKAASVNSNQPATINSQLFEEISRLRSKIEFVIKEGSPESELDLNYPRKPNPF